MRTRILAAGLIAGLSFAIIPSAAANQSAEAKGASAAQWLLEQQKSSGAFGSASQPADQAAEVIASLSVAGIDGEPMTRALAYLAQNGRARAEEQAAYAGRIVVGLVSARRDPRDFAGIDFVSLIKGKYNPLLAAHGGNLYAEALAGLGLAVANEELPKAFVDRLIGARCAGGGWSWQDRCGRPADTDTTAAMLSLLSLAGFDKQSEPVEAALGWLRSVQHSSGGWPSDAGQQPNSNSTALAITALATLGVDARSFGSADSVAALEEYAISSGALAYMRGGSANLYSTAQGIPALFETGHPFAPKPPRPSPTPRSSLPVEVPLPTDVAVPSLPVEVRQRHMSSGIDASVSRSSRSDSEVVAQALSATTEEPREGAPWAVVAIAVIAVIGVTVLTVRKLRLR